MALTKRHPSEAKPNGRSAPSVGAKTGKFPPHPGHPVRGKGRSAPRGGAVKGKSNSNSGPQLGGKGRASSGSGNYGKAGSY